MLLAIMLMMAFLVITLTYVVAPAIVQQLKRDREAEMIHRGTEYARAIKKFYKKNGRYPGNLDDLDKGQVRFLRQRYTDPLAKDGKWKLLHYGDIQTLLNAAAPGIPAGALGQQGGTALSGGAVISGVPSAGGASSSGFGSLGLNSGAQSSPQPVQQQQVGIQQNPGISTGFPVSSDQGGSVPIGGIGNVLGGSNQPGGAGSNLGSTGGTGSTQTGPFGSSTTAAGNTQFGGGAIVGVASASKEKTIRIYNKKKTYDEWQFIYNPAMDQQNVLLRGPYQPTTIGSTNIGTPASQLNGQQSNGQGQQNTGFGQQNSGFGQPQPQTLQNNFPPDQNQQH